MYTGPNLIKKGLILSLDASNVKSYSGVGNVWNDLSGYKNNCDLIGSIYHDSSHISFDGFGKRCDISKPIYQSSPISVSVWYRRNESNSSTSWRTIFSAKNQNVHYLILQDSSRSLGVWDGSYRDFGYVPKQDNKFHNYFVIYRNGHSASLYVDGDLFSSISIVLSTISSPLGVIGNWSSNGYWSGDISSVNVYNRELSSVEIKNNFNSFKNKFKL